MKETFRDLEVHPFFIERLLQRNISSPTEIQRLVIPRILAGEDVIFRSATGTGKTFAYLLPLFQRMMGSPKDKSPKSAPELLILAPTLELCSQIKQEADFLLQGLPPEMSPDNPVKVSLIIGSANMSRQIETLRKEKPGVIVGNPGRLLQLELMGKLKLNRVAALVLDEGDRLTAEELFPGTKDLVSRINRNRQTLACSATMAEKSRTRLFPLMRDSPRILETEEQEILRERISHWAFFSEGRRKIRTLCSFLAASRAKKVLVFTGQGGQVGNIVSQLQYHRIAAAGLYSDMDKKGRKQSLDDFRAARARVLVSSDLSARGLDIPGISHIVALDVPLDSEAYIHRAGRTGRAGKRGIMVTIGDEEELRRFAVLEKKLGIVVYPKVLYKGSIAAPE